MEQDYRAAPETLPAPRPLTFNLGIATPRLGSEAEGVFQPQVILVFKHELGQFWGFLNPDFARFLAKGLMEHADKAEAAAPIQVPKLHLPPGVPGGVEFDGEGNAQLG